MSIIKKKGMIKLTVSAITAGIIASAICSDNIIIEGKYDENLSVFAAENIKKTQRKLVIGMGERYKLDIDRSALFVVTDPDIVSVDKNGIIKTKKIGNADIIAYTDSTQDIYNIEIRNEPKKVKLDKDDISVAVGEKISIKEILPENTASGKITFTSGNNDIVKLSHSSEKGEFIAVGSGKTRLTVRLYNGRSASCNISVKDAPEIISFDKKYLDLGVGESESLNVIFQEGTGGSYSYFVDKDDIIELKSDNGKAVITALKEGEVFVTAKTYNGVEDRCRIRVRKKPDTLQLNKKEIKLKIGEATTLRASLPENTSSSELSFKAVDDGIVDVRQSKGTARLEAIGEGTTWVTVRSFNGIERSCKVTVTKGPVVEVIDGVTYMDGIMIVNKTYSLPPDFGNGLDKTAEEAFNKMAKDAAKDNIHLRIVSGFRSYSVQASLYEGYCYERGREAADTFSARPGHSEHQSGLAMDINSVYDSFAYTDEAKWMEKNCHKYGFIIRYPKGKENITGYKYESWHIRYVGKDLAETLYKRGITLEEYFDITSEYERK